jgi:hypothetical protein
MNLRLCEREKDRGKERDVCVYLRMHVCMCEREKERGKETEVCCVRAYVFLCMPLDLVCVCVCVCD